MKKRTKLSGILLVCCMGMSLLVPHSFLAEEAIAQAPDYDRVLAAYGDSAKNYLYQAEAAGKPVSVIITSGGKAHTYTDTNLREGPGVETRSLSVLPADAQVLVWGYTDNGWTKVFYKSDEENQDREGQENRKIVINGYIKSDLLVKAGA